jgi:lysozyme
MTRLLGEQQAANTPLDTSETGVPTADEITRAVSALAEPDGPGEDRPDETVIEARQVQMAPPPAAAPVLRQTTPEIPEPRREILRPPALPPSRGNGLNGDISVMRWLPYALLSGLGLWGIFEGVRRTAAPTVQRFPASEGEAFVGPLLAFGSVLLSVLAIYYLYRAITRQD